MGNILLKAANSLIGSIIMGIFLLILGIKSKKFIWGTFGFLACLITGYFWGFPLNIFVMIIFLFFILI